MAHAVPDGGWGWFVVTSAFVAMMMWDGDNKALAVMLPTLREQFSVCTWMVGWVISVLSTVMEIIGPVVGAISENTNIDPRYIAVVGGVLTSFGFIAASFSSSILQLTIFVSILGGTGLGITLIQSNSLVPHYFDKLYPRASGIVTCGSGVAMVIFAPLTQLFLDTYGWRGTLLLIGGINFHLILCGSLLRPFETSIHPRYSAIINDEQHKKIFNNKMAFKQLFSLTLFKNFVFNLHVLIFCSSSFVLSGWFIYLVPHAISKGLQPYQAAAISGTAAALSIFGRIGYFPLVEKNIVSIRVLIYAASSLSAVSLLIDPWMNSFWSLMISSSAYYTGRGVFKSLFLVVFKENVGVEHLASGLGWCLAASGIFRSLSGGLVGWIYDYTGSYDLGFVLLGGAEITSIILLIIEDIYQKRTLKEIKK